MCLKSRFNPFAPTKILFLFAISITLSNRQVIRITQIVTNCSTKFSKVRYKKKFTEQGRRSGESARLPPMWPGFDSWTWCHMWVEFVVCSCPCSEGFSPGSPNSNENQHKYFVPALHLRNCKMQQSPVSLVLHLKKFQTWKSNDTHGYIILEKLYFHTKCFPST